VLRDLNQNVPTLHNLSTPEQQTQKALLHLQQAAEIARAKWTQFNVPLALLGLLVMLSCVAFSLAAACTFLVLFRGLCAVSAIQANSCSWNGSREIAFPILTRYEGVSIALVFFRAAVPFTNSLVLAESQVTQYFLCTSAVIAAAMVYAQMRKLHRFQSRACTAVPCMSPYVAASGARFVLARESVMKYGRRQWNRNQLPSHLLSLLFSCSLPNWAILLNLFTATSMKVKTTIAASLLGLSILVCSYVFPLLGPQGRTIQTVTAFTSLLVLLLYTCSKPTQQKNVHLMNSKRLCFASLVFTRLVICAGLMLACTNRLISIGGIDRVGLSPFQKADQMHPKDLASAHAAAYSDDAMEPTGCKPQFLWYQWLHPVPALLCLAVASNAVKMIPRCVVDGRGASSHSAPTRWCMSEALFLSLRLCTCFGLILDSQVRTEI
jgi:hypothetical protein